MDFRRKIPWKMWNWNCIYINANYSFQIFVTKQILNIFRHIYLKILVLIFSSEKFKNLMNFFMLTIWEEIYTQKNLNFELNF